MKMQFQGAGKCFVDIEELENGGLSVTLRSNFHPEEIVDRAEITKDGLWDLLDKWELW